MQKKKLLILCPYPKGFAAGQRLKYEQYFSTWEDEYLIEIKPFFNHFFWKDLYAKNKSIKKVAGTIIGYLKRLYHIFFLRNYDVIYIFLWVTPFKDILFEKIVRRLSKKLIFDFDDSIHLDHKDHISTDTGFIYKFLKSSKKIKYLIKHSDHVITSSPFNLEYCQELNKNSEATYIPCSLDTDRFIPKALMKFNKNDSLTLGWTGTFSSKVYLDFYMDVIRDCCLELNLKLLLITNFDYAVDSIDLEVIPWRKETEIQDLHRIDIGLYPLIESQWALGKGGLKVMQYMSLGIPSLSTDFGTAREIVQHGHDGFLATSKDDWVKYLKLYVNDQDLRARIGENARQKILKNYSINSNKQKYLEILNGSYK